MPDRKLTTVPYRPDPVRAKATVIDCRPGFSGPYFSAEGDDNCLCGHCDHVLVKGEVVAALTLYLCCPNCGTYNLADGHAAASA